MPRGSFFQAADLAYMVTFIIAPTARKSVLTLDNCFDTRHLQIFARSFSSQDELTVIFRSITRVFFKNYS